MFRIFNIFFNKNTFLSLKLGANQLFYKNKIVIKWKLLLSPPPLQKKNFYPTEFFIFYALKNKSIFNSITLKTCLDYILEPQIKIDSQLSSRHLDPKRNWGSHSTNIFKRFAKVCLNFGFGKYLVGILPAYTSILNDLRDRYYLNKIEESKHRKHWRKNIFFEKTYTSNLSYSKIVHFFPACRTCSTYFTEPRTNIYSVF